MKISDFDSIGSDKIEEFRKDFELLLFREYDVSFFTPEFFQSERGHYYRYIKPFCIYIHTRIMYETFSN